MRRVDADVVVRWRPFQLDVSLPKEGVNKRLFYDMKFGQRSAQIVEAMTATFAEMGELYSIGGEIGDTWDGHRLMALAEAQDDGYQLQNRLAEALFKAYFTGEALISSRDVLLAAAEEAGVTGAAAVLDDPSAYADIVQDQLRTYAGRYRVRGVPHFVIGGKIQLSGAQDPDLLAEAIEDALASP